MSKVDHRRRMMVVLQFVEDNLDAEPELNHLASLACYSPFHFHRLFSTFVGSSIYAYRKRLLLERAVRHLQHSNKALFDIAASCGYSNQASFNKAFKQQFSATPSQVREHKVLPKILNPLILESLTMDVNIVEQDEINIICARATGTYAQAAPIAWQAIMSFAYGNRHMKPEVRSFGVSHDNPSVTDAGNIRYDAGLDLDPSIDISGHNELHRHSIPAGRYAVFHHKGCYTTFPEAYHYIFHQWFASSGETLRDEPPFEIYRNRDPRRTKPENLRTDIYLPLAK